MQTKQYYEPQQNRLICVGQVATPEFWDAQWNTQMLDSADLRATKETLVTKITHQYLKPDAGLLLEGGCGRGQHVAALVNNGYRCVGIDSAVKTVQFLHKAAPELDIRLGDVRALEFDDNSFTGYWSLGVIEHFWDGYAAIASEMQRVIAPGGYLFLSFPYMSRLRRYKANNDHYPIYTSSECPVGFYQFVLDHQRVLQDFAARGFTCVQALPQAGLLGAKEITVWSDRLRQLADYRGKSIPLRGSRYLLEQLFLPFAGHTMILILRRTEL